MPPIPAAPLWLGLAGLLPFAAAAAGAHLLPPDQQGVALRALLGYGAVILSFLGGVRWGLAIRDADTDTLLPRLAWSVTPSLLGWVALLLPAGPGLGLLAAGFGAALLADWRAPDTPAWYRRQRLPLSLGAILATIVGMLA